MPQGDGGYATAASAEGYANPDLVAAHGNDIEDDAIETDGGERRRHNEKSGEHSQDALRHQSIQNLPLKVAELGDNVRMALG